VKMKSAPEAVDRLVERLEDAHRVLGEEQLQLEALHGERLKVVLSSNGDGPQRLRELDEEITRRERTIHTLEVITSGIEPRITRYRDAQGEVRWIGDQLAKARATMDASEIYTEVFGLLDKVGARLQAAKEILAASGQVLPPTSAELLKTVGDLGRFGPPSLWRLSVRQLRSAYTDSLVPKLERELRDARSRLDAARKELIAG
jgi:hypothetical protein